MFPDGELSGVFPGEPSALWPAAPFVFGTAMVSRGRTVSRVRLRPIQRLHSEYETTPNDTIRHNAVAY